MRRAWRVVLKTGACTMVRAQKGNISFKECLEILDSRGYVHTDIQSLDEVWEEAVEWKSY